jgi:BirA family biotin operon repressor/biotin-[acetyl-CoA-carboxylase] ligase
LTNVRVKLDQSVAATGVRLISQELVVSTNSEALALAGTGERGPLWVVAERQSGGRGRRGREWVSEAGNLFASLLLTDPGPPDRCPELAFVAALAVHDAVSEAAAPQKPSLAIKWPNDLLLGNAKLAGILIEGNGAGAVVIGIGVNCVSHPPGTEYPATDLAAACIGVSAVSLFAMLSRKMVERIEQWNRAENFAAIRADWLVRAAGLGSAIRVRLADREIVGHFETLDETGGLVLRMQDGFKQIVTAGDVVNLAGHLGGFGRTVAG